MKKIRDIDYVFISTRIHAMERSLLTGERIQRMLDATTNEDAAKVLEECGYGELTNLTAGNLEQVLTARQEETAAELAKIAPDKAMVDVFRLRYDYHNAKVLAKAEALGSDPKALLLGGGRYGPEELAENFAREELKGCSDSFRRGLARARELLGATGDPQQADFALDRAYFEEMSTLAEGSGSEFLKNYVKLLIDVANLRAAVRASRLGKGAEFLDRVLVEGGSVSPRTLLTLRGEELTGAFRVGPLAEAAAEGAAHAAPGSGTLTEFERLCDDAVMHYLDGARMVSFGPETVIGYLHARETEVTAIRTIMSGRMAGLDSDTIRQRLRRTYA